MVETQSEIVYCQPVKPNYIRQMIASKANSADATGNVAEEFSVRLGLVAQDYRKAHYLEWDCLLCTGHVSHYTGFIDMQRFCEMVSFFGGSLWR